MRPIWRSVTPAIKLNDRPLFANNSSPANTAWPEWLPAVNHHQNGGEPGQRWVDDGPASQTLARRPHSVGICTTLWGGLTLGGMHWETPCDSPAPRPVRVIVTVRSTCLLQSLQHFAQESSAHFAPYRGSGNIRAGQHCISVIIYNTLILIWEFYIFMIYIKSNQIEFICTTINIVSAQ